MNPNINFKSKFFGIITNFFNCMTINNCKKQITDMKHRSDNAAGSITLFAALALAVAAMPALTSCDKEKSINSGSEGEKITLTATVEQPSDAQAGNTTGTKTILDAGGAKVNWQVGDVIKIFSTVSGNLETTGSFFTTAATGTKGPFTGTLVENGQAPFYAYYPAENINSIDAGTGNMTVTLPAVQTYKENSFGKDANPAVAYAASGTDLVFKNLCGMVKLNLYSATALKVRSISLMNSTEKLSGAGTVTVNKGTGIPALTMKTDLTASNYVKLDCGETGVTLSTDSNSPTVFYIVVPPSTGTIYGYEVSVQFTDGTTVTGYMSKSAPINTANKIEQSKYRKMPTFAASISANDYIYEEFDYGAGTTISSTTWAPVNCGYDATNYKYGKLYQWGRKYGQGYDSNDATYPSGDNIVAGPVALSVGEDAANADKFFTNTASATYYDWLSPQNGTLWNSGTETVPVRTENDPCPTGWRIPTQTELYALIGNADGKGNWTTKDGQNGRWFDGTTGTTQTSGVFLPAAGFWYYVGGGYNRLTYGTYWSSTSVSQNAYFLSFFDSETKMKNDFARAYGLAVRCVKN